MNKGQLDKLETILNNTSEPFYTDLGFWIGVVLSIIGIIISWIAYKEAEKAKNAAYKAGNFVRIQSITIELTEIIQRLDKINPDLDYSTARDFFNELSRRIRRSISVISQNEEFSEKAKQIIITLNGIKKNLDEVRKTAIEDISLLEGINLYLIVEGEFSTLSGDLAELCGILEQKTIEQ